MIIEKYSETTKETAISFSNTRVESLRNKNITKTGVRVYDDNKIGIAGAIGQYDESELVGKAKESLKQNVAYPYEISKDTQMSKNFDSDISDEKTLLKESEEILEYLRTNQPEFSFSHKIILRETSTSLKNDIGLSLSHKNSYLEMGFLIKEKGSPNIMDAMYGHTGWSYDRKILLNSIDEVCNAYKNKINDFEDGEYPVVFLNNDYTYLGKMYESLHGMFFGSGTSLFSNKIGQKLFNDNFTLSQTMNPEDEVMTPFFDMEGTINKDYRFDLIKDGVLISPYTAKKVSKTFNLPLTGAAGGTFDSVPAYQLLNPNFKINDSGKTMKELLGGRKAVFVLIASGGDFTSDGHFASPVQVPFLFDGEKFIGKLPELNISSHIFDMFGKDFIGLGTNSLSPLEKHANPIAFNMKVSKIG